MKTWLTMLLINLRIKLDLSAYKRGYNWVIKAYFVDQIEFKTIEKHCYKSNSAFDRGCKEALFKIGSGGINNE